MLPVYLQSLDPNDTQDLLKVHKAPNLMGSHVIIHTLVSFTGGRGTSQAGTVGTTTHLVN